MDYARLTDGAADAITDALAGRVNGIAVDTSGSTGTPTEVLLPGRALRASAAATAARLGGDGHWVLALPTDRIAGAMVVVRAALGGTALASVSPGSFTADAFVAAAQRLPSEGRRYTSLVPTQLRRVMADAGARDALASFDAVLVGGAALGMEDVPAPVVRTYGMTETSGGCVYDGKPIGDTTVRIREDGRILIATSALADGYRPERPDVWEIHEERRWLVTSDLGEWADDGSLRVLGRADHVINTGGFKVHPRMVEQAVDQLDWVHESAVVGAPNAEWGEAVVSFVVPRDRERTERLWDVRAALEPHLPGYALPREMVVVAALPRLPSGKVNYPLLKNLAADLGRNAT